MKIVIITNKISKKNKIKIKVLFHRIKIENKITALNLILIIKILVIIAFLTNRIQIVQIQVKIIINVKQVKKIQKENI